MNKIDNHPNIIDFIFISFKWRKLIIINFIIFTFSTAIISLIIPKTFTAVTTILPPSGDSDAFGLSSFLGDLPLGGLGIGGVTGETNIFLAILNSQTVMQSIAKKFNLIAVYKAENMENTVRALRENVAIDVNDDGTISVYASAQTEYFAYSDEEKNKARFLARDLANAFIDNLDITNKRLKTEKARNNRIFIEKRYQQNLADLQKAEEQLRSFQETYGVIALPEQTTATIQAVSELNAKIIVKEIEVAVLGQYVSSSHVKLSRAKSELNELKRKFQEMKSGKNSNTIVNDIEKNNSNLFIPLNEVPEIGLQYMRLYRDVTLQQKILEFLVPQYEQAKIQEAKDTPTVQVLDKALPPIKRSSPKRTIMVLFSGFLSLIMSFCLIFIFEYWKRIQAEGGEDLEKISSVFSLFKRDFRFRSKN